MNSLIELVKAMTTCGTRACGLLCAALGVVLAALLLSIGFWRTLFVVALGAAGMFAGGVKDKGQFIKNLVNRLFPPKDQN